MYAAWEKVLYIYHFNKLLSLAYWGKKGKRILSYDAAYFETKLKGLARARNQSSQNNVSH